MFGLPDLALWSENKFSGALAITLARGGMNLIKCKRPSWPGKGHLLRETLESAMKQLRVGMGFLSESVWVQDLANRPTAANLEWLFLWSHLTFGPELSEDGPCSTARAGLQTSSPLTRWNQSAQLSSGNSIHHSLTFSLGSKPLGWAQSLYQIAPIATTSIEQTNTKIIVCWIARATCDHNDLDWSLN